MRVGLVCHSNFGGSGVIATELGLELARRGHDVHFICASRPPRLTNSLNVTLHEVTTPVHPLFPNGEFGLALASKLIDVARHLDVLHVHYAIPLATSAVLARDVLGSRAPKLVTTVHGTDVLTLGLDPAFSPMVRHALERSDLVTAPSTFLAARASELAGVSVDPIPNFVDVTHFTPSKLAAPRSLAHNSNFRSIKRMEDVLEIARRIPDAKVNLVGDGPERVNVEAFIAKHGLTNVELAGERRDIVAALQTSRVFLLPSEVESFGLAALEAMACGVPVVASNVGGIPEVVEEGVTGFLHAVCDVEAMTTSVRRLLDDAGLHARMALAARARAVNHFQIGPIVDRWEAAYARLLENKS
ncbi:MAG: N-acetyl-alpha-D-glucosaminyl L-malate synthase BshA [Archangium sp.]